jgi:hypothetical protein
LNNGWAEMVGHNGQTEIDGQICFDEKFRENVWDEMVGWDEMAEQPC